MTTAQQLTALKNLDDYVAENMDIRSAQAQVVGAQVEEAITSQEGVVEALTALMDLTEDRVDWMDREARSVFRQANDAKGDA